MNYNPQMQGAPLNAGAPNQAVGYNYFNPYFQPYMQSPQVSTPQVQAPQVPPVGATPSQIGAQQAVSQSAGSILWVENLEEAESSVLSPGSACVFFDKNTEGQYYIRTRNSAGQYQTRVFQSTEITNGTPSSVDMSNYVTKQELSELLSKLGGDSNGKQSVQSASKSNYSSGR